MNAPSNDARLIDEAHRILRESIGTDREALAKAYLAGLVEAIKKRQVKP